MLRMGHSTSVCSGKTQIYGINKVLCKGPTFALTWQKPANTVKREIESWIHSSIVPEHQHHLEGLLNLGESGE